MTREEAIRILDPETRREALREIPVFDRISADQSACRLAVSALRAQQEPVKLDWRKWEGCEYCKGDVDGYTTAFKGWKDPGDMYIQEGRPELVVAKKYSDVARIRICYCPHCGRPLTEEARAELERRIEESYEKSDRN